MIRPSLALLTVFLLAGCSRKPATADAATLEKQFEAMMSRATLVGHSTSMNRDGVSGEERYAIEKVSKMSADTWLFTARMRLGSHEVPLPIPVTMKWAGDTPVIELTDMSIPGMASYTARVVLYGDQYAGTWSGKRGDGRVFGGQLFGKIVHGKE
ncbi:MAG: hypothetical protein ABSB35_37400 [Bryobacteraceae bacterium]|jgi:hypothetical protein